MSRVLLVLDGEPGEWADGEWIVPPELAPARLGELRRRLRQPIADPDRQKSIEVESGGVVVIEEHETRLEPGTADHVAVVVRSMGGFATIV